MSAIERFWPFSRMTVPRENILVPFDGTYESLVALRFACELYSHAQINLAYVVKVDRRYDLETPLVEKEEFGDKMLTLGQDKAREWGVKIPTNSSRTALLKAWDPAHALIDNSLEIKATKIILGTKMMSTFNSEEYGGLDPVSSSILEDPSVPEVILARAPLYISQTDHIFSQSIRIDRTKYNIEPAIKLDRKRFRNK